MPNLFFDAPRLSLCGDLVPEPLEDRQLLSVSLNPSGWSVALPSAGDRVVYASNSTGSNANSGLSPSAPVKSLARAESLLRNNTGDEMLLKCNDSWTESLGVWRLSGRSASDPMVIGAMGQRPASSQYRRGQRPDSRRQHAPEVNDLDVIGLNFHCQDLAIPHLRSSVPPPGASGSMSFPKPTVC